MGVLRIYFKQMLQRPRESLTLALIALLPFHALFVTAGTKFLLGPGHPPMQALALWKEGLLALVLLIAVIEFVRRPSLAIDLIDGLIVLLIGIGITLFFYRPWMTATGFIFGFKYDFIPLITFLILRRVQWSDRFRAQAENLLLVIGGVVALYGILTFFAPAGFFRLLGYSDVHSLYLPDGPLAAFQQISGSALRRAQSTFSGPNQFGLWLLIPFSIAFARAVASFELRVSRTGRPATRNPQLLQIFSYLALIVLAIILSFSRSAWIGAFVIAVIVAWTHLPRRAFRDVLIGILSILAIAGVAASLIAPSVFLRATSTREHVVRPLKAINEMIRYPLGMGLGAAGPAANRTHEPCVFLERGADASWAASNPSLCVFIGSNQVQPTDHTCDCPLLPENWYLQVGVELGVPGFVLYIMLIVMVLWRLRVSGFGLRENSDPATRNPQLITFLLVLAISIAALFLHAWEDAAVAYTVWVLTAGLFQRPGPVSPSSASGA